MTSANVRQTLSRLPWQFSACLTLLLYLGSLFIVLRLPCHNGLLFGFCGLGRALVSLVLCTLLPVFCAYLLFQWRSIGSRLGDDDAHGAFNRRALTASLFFCAAPIICVAFLSGADPDLKPYALDSLRANGKAHIRFESFSDSPIYDPVTGKLLGLTVKGTICVDRAGTYRVQPMRLKGLIPISIRDEETGDYADMVRQRLEADSCSECTYLAVIEPVHAADRVLGAEHVERTMKADRFGWQVLWQVESYPPFPLYLLGIGAFAQVFPDPSGEFAYVTHVDSRFQTAEYTREEFDFGR